jgi:H+/Cl- antiporter ClcA
MAIIVSSKFLRQQAICALISIPVSIAIGSTVALFLWLLNWATHLRFSHVWLLYLLPAAGVGIHLLYKLYGKSSEKGNNLIIDEIHEPGAGVPKRMGPLILTTTVVTHLFGGSAGREGTAVQIGGSIAGMFAGWFKLGKNDTTTLLSAGVAAGFGAVFGTPFTGAIFAVEVLTLRRINFNNILPCLVAATIADVTLACWGIKHTIYHITALQLNPVSGLFILLVLKIVTASVFFGVVSMAFAETTHFIKSCCLKFIKVQWLIPVLGGLVIILLTLALGKSDYLGLGVEPQYTGAVTIVSAFNTGGAQIFSWFSKLAYTAITLGTGFKGGEVTPLFYIGATLGNTIAQLLNAPVSLFAGLGFIAVFAGATNTPLACTIMGAELFGSQYLLFFTIACFTAYLFNGNSTIYASQKNDLELPIMNGKLRYVKQKFHKYSLGLFSKTY